MLFLKPVARLSRATTLWPFSKKWSTRLEAMKPAPPVINIFIDCFLMPYQAGVLLPRLV